MSDTVIAFIPANPLLQVSTETARQIEQYLVKKYAGSFEIQINRSYLKPFFIDSGGNFDNILCPTCRNAISIPEWQDLMCKCWIEVDHGFDLNQATLNCCNSSWTLDKLVYVPNQGFAMASFEITNPSNEEHESTINYLANLLKTPINIIVARY